MSSNITPRKVIDNLSDTARSVSITTWPYRDHFTHDDVTGVVFSLPEDFQLGALIDDGSLVVMAAFPRDKQEREKYGMALLQRAVQYAADHELRFFFNHCTSDIRPLLSQMRRLGYVVRAGENWAIGAPPRVPSVEVGITAKSFPIEDE